ncbi:MAG TPA: cysteine--tRNA ligase [Acidimicrobiales bacterium]|nr:cysteine--tRNA ligase [Acidimicrobiales bacterium]
MLQLFDTAKGAVAPVQLREPGKVSMYVCGPTVYGPPHLGHGRFSLVFDVLRRYLAWAGLDVTYVSNITDIDDKIIQRAQDEDRDWRDITQRCEAVWYRAMDALNVRRPDHDPHATAYVEHMVALIGRLVDRDAAYETSDGVYFLSETVDDYGLLARQPLDSLKAGARVEGRDEKRSPVDFALWKKAKPGEPSWPSPWGEGRPGWHTECVVMALDLLGEDFDLHGGGQDLAFPHHENERAQAVADGRRFARTWVHNGFVEVEGTKMSKSLGNVSNLLDLVEQYDPRAYRLLVLRSHYRSPIDVTDDTLRDAEAALARLDAFARRVAAAADLGAADPDPEAVARFRAAMDDDLQTPTATGLLFDLVRQANVALDAGDTAAAAPLAAAAIEIAGVLGLELHAQATGEVPAEVHGWAAERDAARAAKDWPRADALRDQIAGAGYVVEDTPAGAVVRPA